MSAEFKWTDANVATLTRLYVDEKLDFADIATTTRWPISVEAIKKKAYRLGLNTAEIMIARGHKPVPEAIRKKMSDAQHRKRVAGDGFNWYADGVEERLKDLWASGLSANRIAQTLDPVRLTANAVIGRIHRLKLPARPTQPPRPRASLDPIARPRPAPRPPSPAPSVVAFERSEFKSEPGAWAEAPPRGFCQRLFGERDTRNHFCAKPTAALTVSWCNDCARVLYASPTVAMSVIRHAMELEARHVGAKAGQAPQL